MQVAKAFFAALILTLCMGCTTYRTVALKNVGAAVGQSNIRSSCSELVFEPGQDVKVGDDIRYQTCDGRSDTMKVTSLDARRLTGGNRSVQISEIKSLEIKQLSIAKTALYGLAGGTVAFASVSILIGLALVSALPHIIVGALFG